MFNFTHAIVRAVPRSLINSFRSVPSAIINPHHARVQHGKYVGQLRQHIPNMHYLAPDNKLPDCPFVESTATVIENKAIISNMGRWPLPRRGEINEITKTFAQCQLDIYKAPIGTHLDGGDVINTKHGMLVALSARTNEDGVGFLSYVTKKPVYVIRMPGQYVLKSLATPLDEDTMVVAESTIGKNGFKFEDFEFEMVKVPDIICANVVRIADTVLMPSGFPKSEEIIRRACEKRNLKLVPLNISEFIKADGDMSCLSILF